MLQRMTRAQIIGTRSQLDVTIAALHRLGVLHIEDQVSSGVLKDMKPDEAIIRLQANWPF